MGATARMLSARAAAMTAADGHRGRRLLLGCLSVAALLASPAVTSASAMPEMRGEWRLVSKAGGITVEGVAIVSQEVNGNGEFAASEVLFQGSDPGTFSGTIKGAEASVVLTTEASGGFPATEFKSESMQVQESPLVVLTGPGTIRQGSNSISATLTATRVKTYGEVQERLEREKREHEEALARSQVRGEWDLQIEAGSNVVHGVARITQAANLKNEFASASALFEGSVAGSFTGVLEGGKATVTIATQASGPYPASTFTSNSIAVTSSAEPTSMSGSGTVEIGGMTAPATLVATRTKSYAQLQEEEAQQKLERERQEKAEREARERLQGEERERLEREARESREKLEREMASPPTTSASSSTTTTSGSSGGGPGNVSVAVRLAAKTLLVAGSGAVSLPFSNPGALTAQVHVTLSLPAHASRAASRRHGKKAMVLGSASFAVSPGRSVRVTIKLSKAGRALLARHATLHAIALVLTKVSGQATTSSTYRLTLHASPAHGA